MTTGKGEVAAARAGFSKFILGFAIAAMVELPVLALADTYGSNTYGAGAYGAGGDTTAPSAPTGLTATAASPSQIDLAWTASTDNVGVAGYKIFRAGAQAGTSTSTGFSDSGLSANTTYSYTVSAYDAAGNNSAQSVGASATTQKATPAPTVTISANPVSIPFGGSSTLTWSSTDATSCTASGGWSGTKATSGTETRTNLTATATYTLTCAGSGGSGNASVTISVSPGVNLALQKPATASSVLGAYRANKAFDGNTTTRWASKASDPQWIYVDLGSAYTISGVRLSWDAAYARSYKIDVSGDTRHWTSIYSTTAGSGGINDVTGLSGIGRYVRMYGTQSATPQGYSLREMQVFGTISGQ